MPNKYITPVVGQIYANRNGEMYRCTGNKTYPDDVVMQRTVELGEHWCSMIRLSDGWAVKVHGVFQYEDGSIEWRFSSNGSFVAESLAQCWKTCGSDMYQYFEYLDDLRDSGEINMLGAVPYLQHKFLKLAFDRNQAKNVLQAWMDSYKDRSKDLADQFTV